MNTRTINARLYALFLTFCSVFGVLDARSQGVVNDTMHFNRRDAHFFNIFQGQGNGAIVTGAANTGVGQSWEILRYNWQHGDSTHKFLAPDSNTIVYYQASFAGRLGPIILVGRGADSINNARAGLIFLDTSGQLIDYWTVSSPGFPNNELSFVHGAFFQDKYFLLARKAYQDSTVNRSDMVLIITDNTGSVIKEIDYATPEKRQYPYHIIIASDSTLALGYTLLTLLPNQTSNLQAAVLTIDTSGQINSSFTTSTTDRVEGPQSVVASHDLGLVMILKVYGHNNFPWYKLVKINSFGQEVWTHQLDAPARYGPVFTSILEAADGSLLVTGQRVTDSSGAGIHQPATAGVLLKVSPQGARIWSRQYEPISSPQRRNLATLRSSYQLPSEDILLAGAVYDASHYALLPTSAWILKVDSMGCLIPGCAVVNVKEEKKGETALKVYPNPTNDLLYVNFQTNQLLKSAELRLSDMQGRIRFQNKAADPEVQYILPVHELEAGVYLLQLIQNGQLMALEKVVVGR